MLIKLVAIIFVNISVFSQIVSAQPANEQNLFRLGEQYFQTKDYERALEVYTKLTADNPNNQIYFDRYWRSLFETGKYPEAHDAVEKRVKSANQDMLINEMARISFIMGKPDQAQNEWKQLLDKYPGNISVIKLIGNTMLQLKQYDWVVSLYKLQRKDQRQFAMDLANIYTITYKPEDAANEYLNLLLESPTNEGYLESRINQYFSDSLSSSKMVDIFVSADRSNLTPSIERLTANLYRNMTQHGKALQYYMTYDKKVNNQGSSSVTFLTQKLTGIDLDSLQVYSQVFRKEFPASRFTDQLDVRLFQAFVDQDNFNQNHFLWIEEFYNKRKDKVGISASLSELYLKAVLKSNSDNQTKRTKILSVMKSQRGINQSYWLWALESLNENYSESLTIFSETGVKSKMPLEYIHTSIANGISVDTIRNQLFVYSSEFTNKNVPRYLYLLIQSLPLPNINFREYTDFAKAEIQSSIFQIGLAKEYFRKVTDTATDQTLIKLAEVRLTEIAVAQKDVLWINQFYEKLKSGTLSAEGRDDVLFLCGRYFYENKIFDRARYCFEQIIEKNISSPFAPLSRNYLNEIRKSQS